MPNDAAALLPHAEPSSDLSGVIKLSVRLSAADSAALATQAAAAGLSQARFVALLIRGIKLPMPAAERRAELAALRASNNELAAIAADVSLVVRALSRPDVAALAPCRQRTLNLDADIARHLQIATALLARMWRGDANNHFIDGALMQWRDRLFYPGNRIVRSQGVALSGSALHDRARAIRQRLHATVVRGAPQVMVKVTGGGRGMGAIDAHFRYIGKHGRLPIEDDRGVVCDGKDGVQALVE